MVEMMRRYNAGLFRTTRTEWTKNDKEPITASCHVTKIDNSFIHHFGTGWTT